MGLFWRKKDAEEMINAAVEQAINRVTVKSSDSQLQEWRQLAQWLGIDDVQEDALSEATYFACLKVLSEAVGKLPLKLLRHTEDGGIESARTHSLWYRLHDRPNPYQSASIFWSTVEYNRNHFGNAYVWIEGAGRNMRLWILPTTSVKVWYDDAMLFSDIPDIYYLYSAGGKMYRFGSEEILHFRGSNTLNGIIGISVREQLKKMIGGGIKSQKLINDMYDSGFTSKAVLQYTGSLNDANVKAFVQGIEAYAKGKYKAEGVTGIIPIPLGASLTPLNIKLADNQFLELRQYTALQIASAFGIKPYQIGDYTKSSYSSAEAQQLSFLVDTLLYILKQYEEELTYKLLTAEEIEKGYYFKFNVDVMLRADFKTKIETLSKATNNFLMTPNEARLKLDLGRKPGGDRLLGNGASIPVEYTGSQYTNGLVTDNGPEPDDDPDGDGEN